MSEQGSAQWFQDRLGNVTASPIFDVTGRTQKGGYYASRAEYMAQIVAERLTGEPYEHFVSKPMQWGTDTEPYGRSAYEAKTGVFVDLVGFVPHPMIERSGASPDGLVGEDGLVEIKCPTTVTHITSKLTREIDKRYLAQMQWQMACTGRAWCDFVSYDPRLPEPMCLMIERVARDDEEIARMEMEVREFLRETEEMIERLREAG